MKWSLSTRLVLSYLTVILIGMAFVAPLAWMAVEHLYLNTQSTSLLAQAQLVASALHSDLPAPDSPPSYSQVSNALPGIHTRVLDAQGAVVIDLSQSGSMMSEPGGLLLPQLAQNATNTVSPQELMSRPEIMQALSGQSGTAIRQVEAAGEQRVLYAAAPVFSSDGRVSQIVYLATPLPDTRLSALPETIRWQFAGVILAAILVSGASGLWLARRIVSPLGKLVEAAHAVADGNLQQTAPVDTTIPELAVLGQAFNQMTAQLRQSDLAKTAFISDVTHELRTPLTVIKGSVETLQDGAIHDLSARDTFLSSMNRETDRLIRLVNDLLVLTRADAGALNLQPGRLNLEELAHARCDYFGAFARQRQVHLVTRTNVAEGQANDYFVLADADRLAQVLDNLLDNAIRYSPAGAEVVITLSRTAGQVVCQVCDAGPGIPARHLELIFERFYRVDPSRERGQGGSGLGLSIVRSLVQAHGGQVSARSDEGLGTTITIMLPAA